LIIYCFKFNSRIFHSYGDVTIAGERLQNFGTCSAFSAFEQGRIFILPHLQRYASRFFQSPPKDSPILLPLTTCKEMQSIHSNPDPRRSFSNKGQQMAKKLMLEGFNESRLKSSFWKFCGCYYDLVCDDKLSVA
jgi:hypothetical protein